MKSQKLLKKRSEKKEIAVNIHIFRLFSYFNAEKKEYILFKCWKQKIGVINYCKARSLVGAWNDFMMYRIYLYRNYSCKIFANLENFGKCSSEDESKFENNHQLLLFLSRPSFPLKQQKKLNFNDILSLS